MGLFKRNPLKNVKREDVVDAIIELEKKKDELSDDVFIREKQISDKMQRGKHSKSLSEKKMLANEILMLQRQVKAAQKRIMFIDKKIYVTGQIKLAIDDKEFADYNKKSTIGQLFKNNASLEKFLTGVVDEKTYADQELNEQIDMVDSIMNTYMEDDNLYGESQDVNNILSMMEEDTDDIQQEQPPRERVSEQRHSEPDLDLEDPFKEE
jgi:hypothetical protein